MSTTHFFAVLLSVIVLQCSGPAEKGDGETVDVQKESEMENEDGDQPAKEERKAQANKEQKSGKNGSETPESTDQQETEPPTSVKAAKIIYEYSGNWQGTEIVFFDNYGKRVVVEQDIIYSEGNRKRQRLTWNGSFGLICKYESLGDVIYSCEKVDKRSIETKLSSLAKDDEAKVAEGYKETGKKTIVDKETQGWKSDGETELAAWVWDGIDLRVKNQGSIKEAVHFKEIDAIPSDKISAPPGFDID